MEKDIGKLKKNDTTDIMVRVDDFGGRKGLTIREYVTSERYTGFTKAGVRISAADFVKFREMVNSIPLSDMAETAPSEGGDEGSTEPKEKQKTFKTKAAPKKAASEEELPDY